MTPHTAAPIPLTEVKSTAPQKSLLKEDEPQQFTSILLPDGAYQLKADDRVLASMKLQSAHAISFQLKPGARFPGASGWAKLEFRGDPFPEQWQPGYAGILVEPLDDGQNTVRDLRYGPGIIRNDVARAMRSHCWAVG